MANLDIKAMAERFQGDKKSLMDELAECARKDFVDNFDSQSFEGRPWPGGKDYHELVDTGELRSAVEGPDVESDEHGFRLTVESPYAGYQNYGTDTIPKRQFLGQSMELKEKMAEIIKDKVKKYFQR